jgi:hypothetical protein
MKRKSNLADDDYERVRSEARLKLRFWRLKATAEAGNNGIDPYGMLNQSCKPTQSGHVSHVDYPPPSRYEVTNIKRQL